MEKNEVGLVPIEQTRLPVKLKQIARKTGKIAKYSLLTAGFGAATVTSMAVAPVLTVPVAIALAYNG